jgi:hypothetical protein
VIGTWHTLEVAEVLAIQQLHQLGSMVLVEALGMPQVLVIAEELLGFAMVKTKTMVWSVKLLAQKGMSLLMLMVVEWKGRTRETVDLQHLQLTDEENLVWVQLDFVMVSKE